MGNLQNLTIHRYSYRGHDSGAAVFIHVTDVLITRRNFPGNDILRAKLVPWGAGSLKR
jgi:hypothetical protein